VSGPKLFWRAVDWLDYRVMDARLRLLDALCGPEPETEAERQRDHDPELDLRGRRPALHVHDAPRLQPAQPRRGDLARTWRVAPTYPERLS
jgi:hypothetical protein